MATPMFTDLLSKTAEGLASIRHDAKKDDNKALYFSATFASQLTYEFDAIAIYITDLKENPFRAMRWEHNAAQAAAKIEAVKRWLTMCDSFPDNPFPSLVNVWTLEALSAAERNTDGDMETMLAKAMAEMARYLISRL